MIKERTSLRVERFCLAIGDMSVGLPAAHSVDTLLETYLDLVKAVRRTVGGAVRSDDLRQLAASTGLDVSFLRNNLARLTAHPRIATA